MKLNFFKLWREKRETYVLNKKQLENENQYRYNDDSIKFIMPVTFEEIETVFKLITKEQMNKIPSIEIDDETLKKLKQRIKPNCLELLGCNSYEELLKKQSIYYDISGINLDLPNFSSLIESVSCRNSFNPEIEKEKIKLKLRNYRYIERDNERYNKDNIEFFIPITFEEIEVVLKSIPTEKIDEIPSIKIDDETLKKLRHRIQPNYLESLGCNNYEELLKKQFIYYDISGINLDLPNFSSLIESVSCHNSFNHETEKVKIKSKLRNYNK